MAIPVISTAARNAFREVLSACFVLKDISDIFTGVGFSDDITYEAFGQRRKLAEDYFATLNPDRHHDIGMLLSAINEATARLTADGAHESMSDLVRLMKQDGYSFDEGTFIPTRQNESIAEEKMMWSLSAYNLICYGNSDAPVFSSQSGVGTFPKDRLFEHTSDTLKHRYESDMPSLAQLPTLVVAEAMPGGEPTTPAVLAQIASVDADRNDVRFRFRRIETEQFSSEEIFGSQRFNTNKWESSRTHWAVKEGNVLEGLFLFLSDRVKEQEVLFPSIAKPRFFRLDDWPAPVLEHVAVMMPFDRDYDEVYAAICRACGRHSLDAIRVDDIYGPNSVIDDVFRIIVQSRFVISDLTMKNPNVLYETGIAHARNREVITIVQNDVDVPFDLRHRRYVKYLPNNEGCSKLEEDLVKTIAAVVG